MCSIINTPWTDSRWSIKVACHISKILVNLLILFFPCDQLINRASQLIVQIVPLILFWLYAGVKNFSTLCFSVYKAVQSFRTEKWTLMKLFIVLHIILTVPIGTKLLCWNGVSVWPALLLHLALDYIWKLWVEPSFMWQFQFLWKRKQGICTKASLDEKTFDISAFRKIFPTPCLSSTFVISSLCGWVWNTLLKASWAKQARPKNW